MTLTDHPAVAAYLARFDAVSAHLPASRRQELRADLLEHLADAVPAGADDAAIRAALDRLGPPEDIVRAEQGDQPAAPPPTAPRGLAHEGLAVAFLTVGSFVPVIGWLVGVVLLWTSRLWTTREKVAGTLLVPFGPGAALFVGLGGAAFVVRSCSTSESTDGNGVTTVVSDCPTGTDWAGVAALVAVGLVVLLPFVVGAVLLRRASNRARA